MKYQEVEGDLIQLALNGEFNVIAHGCNCFCTQSAGIAKSMNKTFDTMSFEKEEFGYRGDINKLGTIDYNYYQTFDVPCKALKVSYMYEWNLIVVNAYTQYVLGPNLDYNALTLCLRKMNHIFKGKHIGLPLIGCGIAGGIWDLNEYVLNQKTPETFRQATSLIVRNFKDVKTIIQEELKDCDVTIVHYKK